MIPNDLEQLANACGLLTSYMDVHQQRKEASIDSILAVLHALGVEISSPNDATRALGRQRRERLERGTEPVVIAWDHAPIELDLALPTQPATNQVKCTIQQEGQSDGTSHDVDIDRITPYLSPCGRFATRRLTLPHDLDWGYHRLTIESKAKTCRSWLIAAPTRAYSLTSATSRDWGCFLSLYALRSARNWGAGDFTDLRKLTQWTAGLGGRVVGTLPMLAAFLDEPCEPSPYAPASRLAWNEFYVDVASVPEMALCTQAVDLVQSAAFQHEVTQLRRSDRVDYRRLMALKRRVLEILADAFFQQKQPQRFARFEQFLRQHAYAEDYAEFRAAYERRGEPPSRWPRHTHEGRLSGNDYDLQSKRYHLYSQWIATEQLEQVGHAAEGGLYLDLPLGVRPDGYDVWRWSDAYALSVAAGSPPDALWATGQNWGFPPLHPASIREQGYRHVRDYLAHHLQLARLLRIDHVMQFHRLYWIPHGLPVNEGVYVRYRPEEFYAILNLESHRCRTTLVGENLGTVPPEVDTAMERHNLRRMYVAQYEVAAGIDDANNSIDRDRADTTETTADANRSDSTCTAPRCLRDVPADALASLNTHDMPTFAAWWRGADISLREQLRLLTQDGARREWDHLKSTKERLTKCLRLQGWLVGAETADMDILLAILKFISASKASVVLVNLEDLWLELQPQNVPGTGSDLPNWRRKSAVAFEEFAHRPDVLGALRTVARFRQEGDQGNHPQRQADGTIA